MSLLLGNLAHLPDLPPDASEHREKLMAAIRADAEAEALGVPRETNEDPLALPMPGMTAGPAVGSMVRDKLSGQTGTVVEAPGGAGIDYGEVVFVKNDADGQTHPMLSKFLEPVAGAGP